MGNKNSAPRAPTSAVGASGPPPLTDEQKCRIRKQELNQIQTDVSEKQKEVNNCDPKGYYDQRLKTQLAENENWINVKRREFDDNVSSLKEVSTLVNDFTQGGKSNSTIFDLHEELKARKQSYEKETDELQKKIRANRRRFLDASPQEGVPSILLQRTSDDKVLLFFWTVFLTFLVFIVFIGLSYYQKSHSWKTYVIIIAPIWGATWFTISRYA